MAENKRTPLEELDFYIGKEINKITNPLDKYVVENILERTVGAVEAGVAPSEIRVIFRKYFSSRKPDRTG